LALEQEALGWEHYSHELEDRLKNLEERYNELAVNAGKVVIYAKSVERKRDDILEENGRLRQIIADLRSQGRST
jgi:hypothetical protein